MSNLEILGIEQYRLAQISVLGSTGSMKRTNKFKVPTEYVNHRNTISSTIILLSIAQYIEHLWPKNALLVLAILGGPLHPNSLRTIESLTVEMGKYSKHQSSSVAVAPMERKRISIARGRGTTNCV